MDEGRYPPAAMAEPNEELPAIPGMSASDLGRVNTALRGRCRVISWVPRTQATGARRRAAAAHFPIQLSNILSVSSLRANGSARMRGPMTGSAKQSIVRPRRQYGLLPPSLVEI